MIHIQHSTDLEQLRNSYVHSIEKLEQLYNTAILVKEDDDLSDHATIAKLKQFREKHKGGE